MRTFRFRNIERTKSEVWLDHSTSASRTYISFMVCSLNIYVLAYLRYRCILIRRRHTFVRKYIEYDEKYTILNYYVIL